eukprot:CAMPEP_0184744504 /NCGR_PEP_ID=MMETSP0315-20130426/7234_1 /TAXON_ID=101924 /ORGANISM="Rhodosorus marinus, Strain UTEX LB 2760" /LENGTH=356 /DNA_ID=CAMNT_0027216213 /DNA_START=69 /DNA_END=1139 /DNA_ORIENTATION=-
MARPEKGHGDLKGDLEPDLGPDLEKPEGVVREDDGAAQKKDGSRVRFSEEAKIIHHHEQSNGNDGPTSAEDADNQTSTGRRVRFVGEAVIEEDEVKGPPDEDPSEQAGDVEDDEAEGEDGGAQDDDEYVDEEDDFEEDDEDAEEDGVDVEALGSITDVLPNQGALLELLKSGKAGKNELIEATRRGDLETVESLLTDAKWIEAINDVDIFDYTALHFACEEGHVAIVTSLLEAHADIECATKMHFSRPLHYAAFNGHRNVVLVLAKAGADLEARTDDGRTALFQASFNGHHSIVKALLDLEANHLAKDLEGRLPLDVAENEETRKVLRAAGVKGLMEEQKEGTQAEPRIGSKRKSG